MVEHTAVNRGVVGSSPTRGVIFMQFIIGINCSYDEKSSTIDIIG